MTIPYASATSGSRAREEVIKILRRFGCEKTGFMDDDAKHEVILYFRASRSAGAVVCIGEGLGADVAQREPALTPRPQVEARA
jgi:hypothetical protein